MRHTAARAAILPGRGAAGRSDAAGGGTGHGRDAGRRHGGARGVPAQRQGEVLPHSLAAHPQVCLDSYKPVAELMYPRGLNA